MITVKFVPFEYVQKPNICWTKSCHQKGEDLPAESFFESMIQTFFFVWEMYVTSERESNSYQIYFLNV